MQNVEETPKKSSPKSRSRVSPPAGEPLKFLPGLEVVGRGIYLRPYHPHELKLVLFERRKGSSENTYSSPETDEIYEVPTGYAVDSSPPLPAGQALNKVSIEESFERFQKKFSISANVAGGNAAFSIDASASNINDLRSEEDAYYAVRSSFVPLWTVYLPDVSGVSQTFETVPAPFEHKHRNAYDKFFKKYGSHYVKRAWVGGKAALTFTVSKSTSMTKAAIQAGINGSVAGANADMNFNMERDKQELLKNSQCTVFGKGGYESKLAALSSLDETAYNAWLPTIAQDPQTIELEVAGIWTLVDDDDQAQALKMAYRAATVFPSLSAAFSNDGLIYFLRGDRYSVFNVKSGMMEKPKLVAEHWPDLGTYRYDSVNAVLRGDFIKSKSGDNLSNKLYLFKAAWCIRMDLETGKVDDGYPKLISEEWPGVQLSRIDAAFNPDPEHVYFFSGDRYIRFNIANHQADPEYPQRIVDRWLGVTIERIDAVLYLGNGKVLFFRDDQYLRYDMTIYRTDPDYPKNLVGSYVEDWQFFE
jgi:hypothetical protein